MSAALTQDKAKRSKKPRSKDPATNGVQFLTFSHPQDWSSKENRQAVRSHVTRRQHQLSRGEVPSSTQESPSSADNDAEGGSGSVLKFPAVSSHRKRKSVANIDDIDPKKRVSQTEASLFSPVADRFVLSSQIEGPSRVPSPWIPSEDHSATSSAYPSRSNSVTFQSQGLGSAVPDPSLFTLPPNILSDVSARELLFTSMEDYMLRVFAPMGFPALLLTPDAGRVWTETLVHQSKIEPSLRYARLLFASGHLSQIGLLRPEVGTWLHERVVAEMYCALMSEERKLSEGLILATGRIAFYESMFGDRRMAHDFHRPAQLRMISARGGMEALMFPEAVKYLMRWADIVMSLQNGSASLLGGMPEDNEIQPESAEQTLRALAVWLPEQYATLMSERQLRDWQRAPQLETVQHVDPRIVVQ